MSADPRILHTGEARILFGCSLTELEEIACAVSDPALRERCLVAIGLLDSEREAELRKELAWADFEHEA